MSGNRSQNYLRMGLIAGGALLALGLGYVTGNLDTVLTILQAIALLLLSITVLVTVHELGHFLTAKMFGMRVERFSIGFPPKLLSFQKGETEYQIGAIPLGGYVKISSMIDESFDQETIKKEKAREEVEKGFDETPDWAPKPWEFRAKPVWQRLIVMTGGVIMNVILGIIIFTSIKFSFGERRIPISEAQNGIEVIESIPSLGTILGFKTGDKLVSFMGQSFEYFEDYLDLGLLLEQDAYFEVERAGEIVRIEVPVETQNYMSVDSIGKFLFVRYPDVVPLLFVNDSMVVNIIKDGEIAQQKIPTPASSANICSGDRIIGIDSFEIELFSGVRSFIMNTPENYVQIHYIRGEDTLHTWAELYQGLDGKILGVRPDYDKLLKVEKMQYTLWEAFIVGTKEAFGFVDKNIKGFRNATNSDVSLSRSVMGPFQIAEVIYETYKETGFFGVIRLTGILSMILAFVNILPIPALDGGHVLFLLIEGITRREPSVKVRLIAQQFGMLFILGLMVLILVNDWIQLSFG